MNKYFLDSLKFLIKDYKYTSKKFKTVTYFRQSMHSYLLWLHILETYYSKKFKTSEQLVNSLKQYASRKTILTILNNSLKLGYMEKRKSEKDKRISNYIPTEITVKEYEEWKRNLQDNI